MSRGASEARAANSQGGTVLECVGHGHAIACWVRGNCPPSASNQAARERGWHLRWVACGARAHQLPRETGSSARHHDALLHHITSLASLVISTKSMRNLFLALAGYCLARLPAAHGCQPPSAQSRQARSPTNSRDIIHRHASAICISKLERGRFAEELANAWRGASRQLSR